MLLIAEVFPLRIPGMTGWLVRPDPASTAQKGTRHHHVPREWARLDMLLKQHRPACVVHICS